MTFEDSCAICGFEAVCPVGKCCVVGNGMRAYLPNKVLPLLRNAEFTPMLFEEKESVAYDKTVEWIIRLPCITYLDRTFSIVVSVKVCHISSVTGLYSLNNSPKYSISKTSRISFLSSPGCPSFLVPTLAILMR